MLMRTHLDLRVSGDFNVLRERFVMNAPQPSRDCRQAALPCIRGDRSRYESKTAATTRTRKRCPLRIRRIPPAISARPSLSTYRSFWFSAKNLAE